jgi:Mannosyltransferase (PIG-V)
VTEQLAAEARTDTSGGSLKRIFPVLRADPDRLQAARSAWAALWLSRVLVWASGIAAGVAFSQARKASNVFNPRGLTSGLGSVGEVLAGPAARWDAAYYLTIATRGYGNLDSPTNHRLAFFPLYPLLVKVLGVVTGVIVGGVLISIVALGFALYGVHRLSRLESEHGAAAARGRASETAGLAVLLLAFSPMAVFFSADYTESLFMALAVGVFLCARNGRWMRAAIAGLLASATRSPGVFLLLPVLLLYLYGPREDRVPERDRGDTLASRLIPRYKIHPDVLWLALIPVGLLAFFAGVALAGGHALSPLTTQHTAFERQAADPVVTIWNAIKQTIVMHQGNEVTQLCFLVAGVLATVGVLRRLPLAYGLWMIAALIPPLADPQDEFLLSTSRYVAVLFPIAMWLAMWLADHPRLRTPTLVIFALSLVYVTAKFALWHFVA